MFRAYYIKNGGSDGYTCDYKTEEEVREVIDQLMNECGLRFYDIEKKQKSIEKKILNQSEWSVSFVYVDDHDQVHKVIKDFNSYEDVQKFRESTKSHSGEWKDVWKTISFQVNHYHWNE